MTRLLQRRYRISYIFRFRLVMTRLRIHSICLKCVGNSQNLFIWVNEVAVNGLLFFNFYPFQSNHTWIIFNIISSSEAEIVSRFDRRYILCEVLLCLPYAKGSSDYQRSPNPKWWGTSLIKLFEFMLIFELPLAPMQSAPSLD